MKKPLLSNNGVTQLECRRWAGENGIEMIPTTTPGFFEAVTQTNNRVLVFFGDKLPRGINPRVFSRQIHIIESLDHFKTLTK